MSSSTGPVQAQHDLAWIKQALQTAIEVECLTLPIYLSAMFSLKFQAFSVYLSIRNVVMEEMTHMAIAANMLAALGGSPQIRNIKFQFPVQGLPGGVEPDLRVGLVKLSAQQLKNFMRIEEPEFLLRQRNRGQNYPTIASFYADIRRAIGDNADGVRSALQASAQRKWPPNQIADNIGIPTIDFAAADPIQELFKGMDTILGEGEGSSAGSLFSGDRTEDEMSHFARFGEIYYGAAYQDPQPPCPLNHSTLERFFQGRKIRLPEVVNTLAVPRDGYARILSLDPNGTAVTNDLNRFDAAYSSVLSALDDAWNGAFDKWWPTLGGSVDSMGKMRVLSCFNIILRHQIPPDVAAQIPALYPKELEYLARYSDLHEPLFYAPRFLNVNQQLGPTI